MSILKKSIHALACAIFLACGTIAVNAETKVVERSAKKVPAWVGTAVDGYLTIAVQAKSIANAQRQAEDEIAGRIVMAVARNISIGSSNVSSETVSGNNVESRDEFTRTSAIRGANLPFMKGISLAKAEEIYWEKRRDKKTKEEFYDYYVKYPFFRTEQSMLVAQFEEYDAGKEAELAALEAEIDEVDSSEAIKSAMGRVDALKKYFFDNVRQTRANNLYQRYKSLGKSIAMTGKPAGAKKFKIEFQLAGKPFKVYTVPKVTSNCATSIQTTPDGNGGFDITYDNSDCLEDEENWIEVSTRVEGQKLHSRYNLSAAASSDSERFSVIPEGKVIVTADKVDAGSRSVSNLNIRITLNNRGGTPFGLKSAELHFPMLNIPVVADNIDGIYTSKGIIQVTMRAEGEFAIKEQIKSAVTFVNGTLTLVNPATQAVETVRLSLPYTCNF